MTDDWRDDAACRDLGPALFFSSFPSDIARAKALCASCPVAGDCLSVALAVTADDDHGIWGGTTKKARRGQRGGRPATRPFHHGTPGGYRTHLRRDEEPCDECRNGESRYRADRREAVKIEARTA